MISGNQSRAVSAILHGMAGKLLIIVLNAGTGIITARTLQATGRGEQAAMMLWPILLSNAMTLGLPSALTYYARKQCGAIPRLAAAAVTVALLQSVVCVAAGAVLMPVLLVNYPAFVIFYARWFLVNVPIGILMLIARAILEAEGHFEVSILAQWLAPAITLAALGFLWVFGAMTPVTAGMAYSFNSVPVAFWLLLRLHRTTPLIFHQVGATARLLLSYGLRAYGIDLCGTLAAYVDQALVVSFLSPREMGFYVVALSVSRMLNFCQTSVVMVLLPKTAGLRPSDIISITGRAARFSFLATASCATLGFLLSPVAIRALYGAGFGETIPTLRILFVEVTLAGTVMVLAQAPMALGRPGVTTILQAVGLVLTIPLMLWLVPKEGIVGAAYALLITTTCRLVILLAAFPVLLKLPAPSLWFTRNDADSVHRIYEAAVSRLLVRQT